jgi:hypothetical protein
MRLNEENFETGFFLVDFVGIWSTIGARRMYLSERQNRHPGEGLIDPPRRPTSGTQPQSLAVFASRKL